MNFEYLQYINRVLQYECGYLSDVLGYAIFRILERYTAVVDNLVKYEYFIKLSPKYSFVQLDKINYVMRLLREMCATLQSKNVVESSNSKNVIYYLAIIDWSHHK